jgi:retinol dehydrogenase 14
MEPIHSRPMAGKTVLITGGTAGIGNATALGLATMGAHVAITGRDPARTEAAAGEIHAAGGRQVDAFVADLSSQSDVRRLADEVLQRLSRIDVLVNNAGGIGTPGMSLSTGSSTLSPSITSRCSCFWTA